MTEFSELPPLERIKRYRALASDARREASKCDGRTAKLRDAYLLMAERWDNLAVATELSLKKNQ